MPAVNNVLVVGAGLAGTAAAIALAAGGVAVDLVDVKPAVDAGGSGITMQGRTVVEASCQLGQWQLDHEQGDVPGLLATITALVSQPA